MATQVAAASANTASSSTYRSSIAAASRNAGLPPGISSDECSMNIATSSPLASERRSARRAASCHVPFGRSHTASRSCSDPTSRVSG